MTTLTEELDRLVPPGVVDVRTVPTRTVSRPRDAPTITTARIARDAVEVLHPHGLGAAEPSGLTATHRHRGQATDTPARHVGVRVAERHQI
jgi:hypothetical protein